MRHSDSFLNILTSLTAFVFILIALFFPSASDSMSLWIVVASVFVIGIPHGAIDHIMAAELYELNQTLKDHLFFYSSYLLVMVVVGALWIFLPEAGMALFLVISIYHFGQADMEDFLTDRRPGNRFYYVNRGFMIIGLIIFSDPLTTYPIIADAIQMDTAFFSSLMPTASLTRYIIIGSYITVSLLGIILKRIENPAVYLIDSMLLIMFILVTGPLIGFAIYFALWHSAGHINEMRDFFERRGKSLSITQFYKKATPFTLVSILGLALLMFVNIQLSLENQFLSLMFILISVLTLPHMLIVERMYNDKS